ncbi:MAG TPA: HPr family phosphocarrier protein [Candidatus Mcinerneyibacteriales bacterium]|nr:HPr family phosphocarrier protein [Candidatus Mcinerneyibacteriota bacterium]HOO59009.1 HPr family phosphocarrier protein [Candidatus Mcinerneyibacteriales bacterium]HPE20387.1 HPr family phosphocarrier protein [Candidatus Mcinerneyibacteriales bacterium]HPJ69552.1 HPr family phosphocarrier protein [Candidatus Mcinerneyibacteriales bacterium]HPQ88753.1 HPr family phosphocarrier protein [Candidatus Mcinerneyibacteriales bacterium]
MLKKEIEIINKLGLHARAAALLVQEATKFDSEIFIEYKNQDVNAKSILGVMMLAASQGNVITLRVSGDDEEEAMEAIEALINDKFGEGE